jgi:hypothetical protein
MKKLLFAVTLFFFSVATKAVEIERISESCLYDVHQDYSEWKVGELNGLIIDGGGYGVYKWFTLSFVSPEKAEVIYKEGKLNTSTSHLSSFVSSVVTRCNAEVNNKLLRDSSLVPRSLPQN